MPISPAIIHQPRLPNHVRSNTLDTYLSWRTPAVWYTIVSYYVIWGWHPLRIRSRDNSLEVPWYLDKIPAKATGSGWPLRQRGTTHGYKHT